MIDYRQDSEIVGSCVHVFHDYGIRLWSSATYFFVGVDLSTIIFKEKYQKTNQMLKSI